VGSFRGSRQRASACLALAWTGVGRAGAYIQLGGLNAWDWAVGAPFVTAAGGTVTDADGGGWAAPLSGTTGIVAASRQVYADIAPLLDR
jgi:fructose-1,6-bisphosphatase/inositol monophosphatase family enzyme